MITLFSYPEAPALWIFIVPLILIVIHKIYVRIFHGSVKKRRQVRLFIQHQILKTHNAHMVCCWQSFKELPLHSVFKVCLLQPNRVFSQWLSPFLFTGLRHFESLRKPELAVLSSPLTGHQDTEADETQSSQAQEDNIHGVELRCGGSRSHT